MSGIAEFLSRHGTVPMPNLPDWQLWLAVWVIIFVGDFLICFVVARAYNGRWQMSMNYAWAYGDSLFLPPAVAFQSLCLKYFQGSHRWYTTFLFQGITILLGIITIVVLVWQFKIGNDKLPVNERAPLFPPHAIVHHVFEFVPLFWFILAMLIPAFASDAPWQYKVAMTLFYIAFGATVAADQIRHMTGALPIPGRNY